MIWVYLYLWVPKNGWSDGKSYYLMYDFRLERLKLETMVSG